MRDLLLDARQAVRSFARTPGLTTMVLITLALGIGATTAVVSVVHGVLVRPLPYAEPERLVRVSTEFPSMGLTDFWLSGPEFVELREQARCFAGLGGWTEGSDNHSGDGLAPLRVTTRYATPDLLPLLGVRPLRGHLFGDEHGRPGSEPVILLGHDLWRDRWGGDPSLVGEKIRIDGAAVTVLGVLPPSFRFGSERNVGAWRPLSLDPDNPGQRGSHWLRAVGRLAPGVSLGQARADLGGLLARWAEELAGQPTLDPEDHPLTLVPLQEHEVGRARPALLMLLASVSFVLLIACVNVAGLLLARSESRRKEVAVRIALGAGRGRLLRQFLTESVMLSLAGGALGVGVAAAGVPALLSVWPEAVPRARELGIDGVMLGFALTLSVTTGLLFGLAPALQMLQVDVFSRLKDGAREGGSDRGRVRLRSLLVAGEVALAVILVAGAGLMIRSFLELSAVDPGFDPSRCLTFAMQLVGEDYPSDGEVRAFWSELPARLEAVAGVDGAALVTGPPLLGRHVANNFQIEGRVAQPDDPPLNCDYQKVVTPGFLHLAGIAAVAGRTLAPTDMAGAERVVVVNEALARRYFPGEDPVGRRLSAAFRPLPDGQTAWLTIVGVVRDVAERGLAEDPPTKMYLPLDQVAEWRGAAPRQMHALVKTRGDPRAEASAVMAAVWERDPELPLAELCSMDEVLDEVLAEPRFATLLMGLFAGMALALAGVGIYGVSSHSVGRRTHELGIRMALGARPARILFMVMAQGMSWVLLGLALGLAASLVVLRWLRAQLYGVAPDDPATLALMVAVLVVSALLACWIPARRATRVDPARALRCE